MKHNWLGTCTLIVAVWAAAVPQTSLAGGGRFYEGEGYNQDSEDPRDFVAMLFQITVVPAGFPDRKTPSQPQLLLTIDAVPKNCVGCNFSRFYQSEVTLSGTRFSGTDGFFEISGNICNRMTVNGVEAPGSGFNRLGINAQCTFGCEFDLGLPPQCGLEPDPCFAKGAGCELACDEQAAWLQPFPGQYADPASWDSGTVPAAANQGAVFGQAGTYEVSFGLQETAGCLTLAAGDVSFSGGSLTLSRDAELAGSNGLRLNSHQMSIGTGLALGMTSTVFLNLDNGSSLASPSLLSGAGNAIISLAGGSTLTTESLALPSSGGSAAIEVTGSGSVFDFSGAVDGYSVGGQGTATVQVTNGGGIVGSNLVLGQGLQGQGTVVLADASLSLAGLLRVGDEGQGSLLANNSQISAQGVALGVGTALGQGEVVLDNHSLLEVIQSFELSKDGIGSLRVDNGSELRLNPAGDLRLDVSGSGGSGVIQVGLTGPDQARITGGDWLVRIAKPRGLQGLLEIGPAGLVDFIAVQLGIEAGGGPTGELIVSGGRLNVFSGVEDAIEALTAEIGLVVSRGSRVSVDNGGVVATDFAFLGGRDSSVDVSRTTISGAGSRLETPAMVVNLRGIAELVVSENGLCDCGDVFIAGRSDVRVLSGGTLRAGAIRIGGLDITGEFGNPGQRSNLFVIGTGSRLEADDIVIGTDQPVNAQRGILGVTNGATLMANVEVRKDGLFVNEGSSKGSVGDALVTGNVTVAAGGTFKVGRGSQVSGSVSVSGTLELEFSGPGAGQFDQLAVSGPVSMDAATLRFRFTDGYLPSPGDSIAFLTAPSGGSSIGSLESDYCGAAEGLDYQVQSEEDGSLTFTAMTQAMPADEIFPAGFEDADDQACLK